MGGSSQQRVQEALVSRRADREEESTDVRCSSLVALGLYQRKVYIHISLSRIALLISRIECGGRWRLVIPRYIIDDQEWS